MKGENKTRKIQDHVLAYLYRTKKNVDEPKVKRDHMVKKRYTYIYIYIYIYI